MSISNSPPTMTCSALRQYGTSIFTEMTQLVNDTGAINLSQGFPDFDGPMKIREIAAKAILDGPNQYSASAGVRALREAVSRKMSRFYGVQVCPDTQVTVTAGATEGLAATLLGLIEPGDEVVLIEPNYDLYPAIVSRAGGVPVYVSLDKRDFSLPLDALSKAFTSQTRAIVVNNPQNPCGKVFSRMELDFIGQLCAKFDAIAIGDEVYEHLVYDDHSHVTLLDVEGLRDRCVVVSSTAKTFSMTGWKVGFTIATGAITEAIRMAHQFLTYCTPWMFQRAMATGISMGDEYYNDLKESYSQKREILCNGLADAGLDVLRPAGTYFATVRIGELDFADDLAFCHYLAREVGVAAIPASYFWNQRLDGKDMVRFCFCKKDETLVKAMTLMKKWKR